MITNEDLAAINIRRVKFHDVPRWLEALPKQGTNQVMRCKAFGAVLLAVRLARHAAAADIKETVSSEAAKHQPLRIEYSASREAVFSAMEQVIADNSWHWDKRDDAHGDFRIGIPKSPVWQGRLVVYLASVDEAHLSRFKAKD